jgi:1,4-dihydroxy-2-naphthoyl-CoA hydrolase
MIWKASVTLEQLQIRNAGTIHEALGIEFTKVGDDFLEAHMPVDGRTRQSAGILHGGASVVLAESLGSVASHLVVGLDASFCVGIEINASHLSSVRSGWVLGRVTPFRLGRTLHVWDIKIREKFSQKNEYTCISRLTVMVRAKS